MFDFKDDKYTHMPFVAHGAPPDFAPQEFCCIQIEGKWKIHWFRDGNWQRIATGLPEDATECSPFGEYHPDTGKWSVSFIAGGSETQRLFHLYHIADVEAQSSEAIISADSGFVWKDYVTYSGRRGPIFVSSPGETFKLSLADTEFIYRVTQNSDRPRELIVTGQKKDGTLFTWLIDPVRRLLRELTVDGEAAYKAALFKGQCFYAKKGADDDFEARHIVSAGQYRLQNLNFSNWILKETAKADPVLNWEFE